MGTHYPRALLLFPRCINTNPAMPTGPPTRPTSRTVSTGWITVACGKEHSWRRLCDAAGRPELSERLRIQDEAAQQVLDGRLKPGQTIVVQIVDDELRLAGVDPEPPADGPPAEAPAEPEPVEA